RRLHQLTFDIGGITDDGSSAGASMCYSRPARWNLRAVVVWTTYSCTQSSSHLRHPHGGVSVLEERDKVLDLRLIADRRPVIVGISAIQAGKPYMVPLSHGTTVWV